MRDEGRESTRSASGTPRRPRRTKADRAADDKSRERLAGRPCVERRRRPGSMAANCRGAEVRAEMFFRTCGQSTAGRRTSGTIHGRRRRFGQVLSAGRNLGRRGRFMAGRTGCVGSARRLPSERAGPFLFDRGEKARGESTRRRAAAPGRDRSGEFTAADECPGDAAAGNRARRGGRRREDGGASNHGRDGDRGGAGNRSRRGGAERKRGGDPARASGRLRGRVERARESGGGRRRSDATREEAVAARPEIRGPLGDDRGGLARRADGGLLGGVRARDSPVAIVVRGAPVPDRPGRGGLPTRTCAGGSIVSTRRRGGMIRRAISSASTHRRAAPGGLIRVQCKQRSTTSRLERVRVRERPRNVETGPCTSEVRDADLSCSVAAAIEKYTSMCMSRGEPLATGAVNVSQGPSPGRSPHSAPRGFTGAKVCCPGRDTLKYIVLANDIREANDGQMSGQ